MNFWFYWCIATSRDPTLDVPLFSMFSTFWTKWGSIDPQVHHLNILNTSQSSTLQHNLAHQSWAPKATFGIGRRPDDHSNEKR